jgi:hypothetical protein
MQIEQIYVVYTAITPDWMPASHKDGYYERSDGSVVYMRGAPGQDGNLATSVEVFQPDSPGLAQVRSWELGREVIASGTDLSAKAQLMTDEFKRIDGAKIPYVNDDTNSNWAADKALLKAGLSLPEKDNASEFWSPGSIDKNKIGTRGADNYRGGDSEWCFGPEVPIDMWPLDPDLKPGTDGIHDQDEVRAKIWKKPIELIRVDDIVVSFDANDNLVPGRVTRTFQNNAKILLNFHGTRVTPGHVYHRPDSKKPHKFEALIDILRDDGVIKHQDGTLIRAATNVPVGSPRDGFVRAITGKRKADGTFEPKYEGRIRLGTRFLVRSGTERKSFAVADLIEAGGGVVGDDGLIRVDEGPGMPFHWEFGNALPKPEDFVLACSDTTLEDIYKAGEWESQGPRLPAPMVLDRGPVQPLKGAALSAMPRNEPLNVVHVPMAPAKPQHTLNRKHRKAMEARQRKAAKSGKRIAV